MSELRPEQSRPGSSVPAWAWFAVVSVIAIALVAILVVLITSRPSGNPSNEQALHESDDGNLNPAEPIKTVDEEPAANANGRAGGAETTGTQTDAEELTSPQQESAINDDDAPGPPESNSVASIVERFSSGVVLISTFSRDGTQRGVGSGFLIDESGLIATNFHVLRGASSAQVEFRSGDPIVVAGVRAYDEAADLAILEIDVVPTPSRPMSLATTGERPNASDVISVGHPEQFRFTTTKGILSAVHTTAELPHEMQLIVSAPDDHIWLQTTAAIDGGSSGGPLLDMDGQVIGINTWQSQTFGFAADVRHLHELRAQLNPDKISLAELTGPDEDFQILISEYQNKMQWFELEMYRASDQEKQSIKLRDPTPECVNGLLKLAQENAECPISFSCLSYVCQLAGQPGASEKCHEPMKRATGILLNDHCNDRRLPALIWSLQSAHGDLTQPFLIQLAEQSADRDIQGIAYYCLASNLYREGKESGVDQAIHALERVKTDYSDVVYKCGDPRHPEHFIAAEAESTLYDLKNLAMGRVAPSITGADATEVEFSLADYKGQIVVLDFWAAWCPPCIHTLPHQRELVKAYEDKPVTLLGVFCDLPEQLKPLQDSGDVTWRNFMDGPGGPIANAYRVVAYPTIYVLDGDGKVRFHQEGVVPPETLRGVIDELLE